MFGGCKRLISFCVPHRHGCHAEGAITSISSGEAVQVGANYYPGVTGQQLGGRGKQALVALLHERGSLLRVTGSSVRKKEYRFLCSQKVSGKSEGIILLY